MRASALRQKLANIIDGAGTLYRAVAAAASKESTTKKRFANSIAIARPASRHHQQMDEARSELAFSRFNRYAYQAFVDVADHGPRGVSRQWPRIAPLRARARRALTRPFAAEVVERTAQTVYLDCASGANSPAPLVKSADLDNALRDLDADLARLRSQRATAPFALDRMLPFWALVFNLREVARI